MKNRFFVFLLLVLQLGVYGHGSAQAIEGSSQFDMGYGWPNYPKLLLTPGLSILTSLTNASGIGPFTLTYRYGVAKKLAIGLQASYTYAQSSFQVVTYDSSLGQAVSKGAFARLAIIDGGAKADYHFLKSDKYDVYAGLTAGAAHIVGKATENLGLGLDDYNLSTTAFTYKVNAGLRVMLTPVTGLFADVVFQQILLDGTFLAGAMANGGVSFRIPGGPRLHQKH